MELESILSKAIEHNLKTLINNAVKEITENYKIPTQKEWLNLKEAAAYAGVSYNTLTKFLNQGLKCFESDGIKKISRTEIDRFFIENSF